MHSLNGFTEAQVESVNVRSDQQILKLLSIYGCLKKINFRIKYLLPRPIEDLQVSTIPDLEKSNLTTGENSKVDCILWERSELGSPHGSRTVTGTWRAIHPSAIRVIPFRRITGQLPSNCWSTSLTCRVPRRAGCCGVAYPHEAIPHTVLAWACPFPRRTTSIRIRVCVINSQPVATAPSSLPPKPTSPSCN